MTLSIGIAHAAWSPGRKKNLDRLLAQLPANVTVLRSAKKEHASVWATRLWEWAAGQSGPVVCLNDDVDVCPNFVEACEAMLEHAESAIVSLHTSVPAATSLAECGQRFVRAYWATGPGYILRPGVARDVLRFTKRLAPEHFTSTNEDNVLIYHAWSRREPVWSTIPALVKHDSKVPSTLGYDDHPLRNTNVWWADIGAEAADLTSSDFWAQPTEPAQVEVPWMPTASLKTTEMAWVLGVEPMMCWSCLKEKSEIGSSTTGLRLCLGCASTFASIAIQGLLKERADRKK